MNNEQRQNNWTKYWAGNQIESCAAGIKAKNSEVDTFWAETVKELTENSKVLDLCTGKGDVIAKLAELQKINKDKISHYTGVDLAVIEQKEVANRFKEGGEKFLFEYGTDITSLPYPNQTFDLVTSQFGIEYALKTKVVAEFCRVLKSGGKARFVLHHHNSVLVEVAKEEMTHTDLLFTKGGYLDAIEQLLPMFAKLRNPANAKKLNKDQEAIHAREVFNKESEILINKINKSNVPDILKDALNASQRLLGIAKEKGSSAAKAELKRYKTELEQSRDRMTDLVNVAVTKEQLEELEEAVKKFEREFSVQKELKSNSHIVAWGIEIA